MSELNVKDYVFRRGAARRIPVSGTFELTSRCNFRCKMCYIHTEAQERCYAERELTAQQWLDIGREAVDAGMIYLLLTGGEPLLRPDFLEIYTGLIQMGLRISINTNGSLITPRIVECFKKHPPERVNVSLYGMSEETYARLCGNAGGYEKALRGIRMLKEAGICVSLNTTFTRSNARDMEAITALAISEGIPIRTAAYVFPPVRGGEGLAEENLSPEEMGRLLARLDMLTLDEAQMKKRKNAARYCATAEAPSEEQLKSKSASCMAGKGAFWISWEGMLYPCGMLTEKTVNVVQEGIAKAWKETVAFSQGLRLPEQCLECTLRQLCPVCFAVHAAAGCGPEDVPEDMCKRTKAYIRTLLEKE